MRSPKNPDGAEEREEERARRRERRRKPRMRVSGRGMKRTGSRRSA